MDNVRKYLDSASGYTEHYCFINAVDCGQVLRSIVDGSVGSFSFTGLLQNNADYISRAIYYPICLEPFIDTVDYIVIDGYLKIGSKSILSSGSWDSARETGTYNYVKVAEFTVNRIHNDFLDFEPYTKITFNMPFFEPIPLPLKLIYGLQIDVYMSIDVINNNATVYLVRNTDGYVIGKEESKLGIEISVGKTNKEEQTRNNIMNGISFMGSMVGLGVGAASGNPLITAGSVGMLTKTVNKAIETNVDRLRGLTRGNGNRSSLSQPKTIYLLTETVINVQKPSLSVKGGVCKKNLLLSSITGYTEIGEINFNPSGYEITDDEISEIIDLLKSGVIL